MEKFETRVISQRNKDGVLKQRHVFVPSDETRQAHLEILRSLHNANIPMPHAIGSLPSKTLLDGVLPHQNSNHFYMADLADAFPSVDIDHLISIVRSPLIPSRLQERLVEFILNYGTDERTTGLPLGAPASPILFNIYCVPLDRELAAYCQRQGDIVYTRYLDDLTFSSNFRVGAKRRAALRDIINNQPGAELNHKKTKVHDIRKGPVTITGVSIYRHQDGSRRVAPAPHLLESARKCFEGIIELVQTGEVPDQSQIGQMHGYNGVLQQMASGNQTESYRAISALYEKARKDLGTVSMSSTMVSDTNGQLLLFS